MGHASEATTITLPPTGVPSLAEHAGSRYLVRIVPHEEELRELEAMESWFQACSSDEPFALELIGTRKEQGFVLRASSEGQLALLCKQFEAQYPQAELTRLASGSDPLVLRPGEHAVVGRFALSAPSWLPIKTFAGKTLIQEGGDPLVALLAAMETVSAGERVICQVALVRAPESWVAPDLRKTVEHPLQQERDQTQEALRRDRQEPSTNAAGLRVLLLLSAFLLLALGRTVQTWLPGVVLAGGLIAALLWWMRARRRTPLYDQKLVAEKLKRAAFYTQLRVIAIGKPQQSSQEQLRSVLSHLETAYRQLTLASANGLVLAEVRQVRAEVPQAHRLSQVEAAFPYRQWVRRVLHQGAWSKEVLNSQELPGLFHLPQQHSDLPLVRRLSVKHLLFSPKLAHEIATMPAPLPPTLIGQSRHRGQVVPVLLPASTLLRHTFLVGRSRTGKSVLMQHLIGGALQRVTDGSPQLGLFVIDPHFDLIADVLGLIPPERLSEVLLLDFTDTAFPVGLNLLDASQGLSRDQAVSNLMPCFEQVWKEFWGPRMSYVLKQACLLLYTLNEERVKQGRAEEQYTVLDINPFLQYHDYTMQCLSKLDKRLTWHQELLTFWQSNYLGLPRPLRQEMIMPIVSKMAVFNDNLVLRRLVGQPRTTAPIQQAIKEGKIVLCALSSRDLDEASVNILGSTLLNLLHRAFTMQQSIPLPQRRKVFVAVDELQCFTGSMYHKLLSEDGKFGCAMLLATQNLKRLHQLREGLLEDVLTNCDNLVTFNISAVDAQLLEQEMQEKMSQKHIISQPRLHCYARLAVEGHPLQFASVHLAHPASWQQGAALAARMAQVRTRQQAGRRTAAEVDAQHAQHLGHFLDASSFAERVVRETGAMQTSKRQRQAAEDLAAHASEHHFTPGMMHPPQGPVNTASAPRPGATPPTEGEGSSSLQPRAAHTPGETPSSEVARTTSEPERPEGKSSGHTRNHSHSKRAKKRQAQRTEEEGPQIAEVPEQGPLPSADSIPEPRRLSSDARGGWSRGMRERERGERG